MSREKLDRIVNKKGQVVEKITVKYNNPRHPRHAMTRKRFAFIMKNTKGPRVLDIGSGSGLFCSLASKRDDIQEIHGTDLQKQAITEAREYVKDPRVTFNLGFAEDLIYKDNYFDTVVLTETLEHVDSVNDVLSEAHRVLKPGGRVVITVPYKGSLSELHIRLFTKDSVREDIEKYFTIETFGLFDDKDFIRNRAPKIYCVARKDA